MFQFIIQIYNLCYVSGVQRKVDCSGFIIRWDDFTQVATVLTSAKLMRSPLGRDDYYVCMPF